MNRSNVSPLKEIKEERSSPFQRASNLSAQRNMTNSGVNFVQGSFSKTKNNNQQDSSSNSYYNKTVEQNNRAKELNTNFLEKNIVTTTTTTTNVVNKEVTSQSQINQTSQNISSANSGHNIFTGTLVEELSKAINMNEIIQGEFVGNFPFINPIFNTNAITGAFPDESTAKISVDFKQAFNENDPQLTTFPQGGAFCNDKNYFYFTGGEEKQKGVGKIFLRINLNINGKVNMVKMPSMLYSHWNHSMISNEKYIFVIGGYKSNKCEVFNLRTLKWEEMPSLFSNERQRANLAIYGDYLYAFMGYTQFGILDSVERINIKELGKSKWEMVTVTNAGDIDIKFYGAGVYCLNGELYFFGGKKEFGTYDNSYKTDIYSYKFDKGEFLNTGLNFQGRLEFIENEFHQLNDEIIANFVLGKDMQLATLPIQSLTESREH
jgi:hypothetical protein